VMDYFTKLNESGITILMVTHDAALVRYGSRSLTCQGGVVSGGEI